MNRQLLVLLFMVLTLTLYSSAAIAYYQGDDIGYLDNVTINGQQFENFDERQIVFYPEDLRNGRITIRGLLESENRRLPVDKLQVQISMDGGKHWNNATGAGVWTFVFAPELEKAYDFSIRVVKKSDSEKSVRPRRQQLWQIGDFQLRSAAAVHDNTLSGSGTIALGALRELLPERLFDTTSNELQVTFSNLEISGKQIVAGRIEVPIKADLQLPGATLTLASLTFTPDAATPAGELKLTLADLDIPALPVNGLQLSTAGLAGQCQLFNPQQPVNLELFSGAYGATLQVSQLTVNLDSAAQPGVTLAALDGSLQLGSGFNNLQIPDIRMLSANRIGWAVESESQPLLHLAIPQSAFALFISALDIDISAKKLDLSGSVQLPHEFGGGQLNIPQQSPLTLSASGISSSTALNIATDQLPSFSLSGYPVNLTALSLALSDNIPTGTLGGTLVLDNFANLPLTISATLGRDGLQDLHMATEQNSYSFKLADFATLNLTHIALGYTDQQFRVKLDGSLLPSNSLVEAVAGLGEAISFSDLGINREAISLSEEIAGWHPLNGASAQISGAVLSLQEYGLGVEDNKFWVGLKGSGSLAGATVSASARIFHDGSSELTGLDLDKLYLALGDFTLKVERSAVSATGVIDSARGTITGLPQNLISKWPQLFTADGELDVALNGLNIDIANRQVRLGEIRLAPAEALNFELGPVAMQLTELSFSPSGAALSGAVSLNEFGLPTTLPFNGLKLSRSGISGEVNLLSGSGSQSLEILAGEFGFGINLSALKVAIDSNKALADMVSLSACSGSLWFGPGFGNISIPDLQLLSDNTIHWGKDLVHGVAATGAALTLPGGLFSLAELGGSLNLKDKSLNIAGVLILPPALGSARIAIPAASPLTLSPTHGLATSGPLNFPAAELPQIQLHQIPTRLTGLSLAIAAGNISCQVSGEMIFSVFGDLPIAVSAAVDNGGKLELSIDSTVTNQSFTLKDFARLDLTNLSSGIKDDNFYVEISGSLTPKHELLKDFADKVELNGLRIFKNGITLANEIDDWHTLDAATIAINSASVDLNQYGLGVEGGLLWFGVKGTAKIAENSVALTARVFQDGSFSVSDLNFAGMTLKLGDFSLRTTAALSNGRISGNGFINAGFLTSYLPASLKDPLTGELQVSFTDLAVDMAAHSVTSGTVQVDFPAGLTAELGPLQARLNSVSFGSSGAAADGTLSLSSISGIDIPWALSGLTMTGLDLTPAGFKGTLNWPAIATERNVTKKQAATGRGISGTAVAVRTTNPLVVPVLTGNYGISLKLKRIALSVDTSKTSPLDMLSLSDLDGSLVFGPGYAMRQELDNLRLLADGAISWVDDSQLAGLSEDGKEAGRAAATGLSFTIPGSNFKVRDFAGSLYLKQRRLDLWGSIQLPQDFGAGTISLARENCLQLSASGISTQGPVTVDPGSLTAIKLAGFTSKFDAFTFAVANNRISGSLTADLVLSRFDNLPLAVAAAFDSNGLSSMTVAAERLQKDFTIGDFATISLSNVAGHYDNGAFSVTLDGDLTIDNSAVTNLNRSFSFSGLTVAKDALILADMSGTMYDIPSASINLNDSMLMALNQYGYGVSDNRFWVALAGGVSFGNQELTATARLYQDGTLELDQLGGNLLIAIGDFTLRTAFNYADGEIQQASGSLHLGSLMASIPAELKNPFGELPVELRNLRLDLSDPHKPRLQSGSISFTTPFTAVSDYFTAHIAGLEVGAVAGSPYGKISGGSIDLNQFGNIPALAGIALNDIGLSGSGFSGTLGWNGDQTIPLFEHDSYGISARLTRLAIHFDSSKDAPEQMISLNALDGSLLFGSGYGQVPATTLSLIDGAYSFAAGLADSLVIPATSISLKGFSGACDFAAGRISLGGQLAIPFQGAEVAFAVTDLGISASGLSGSVAISEPQAIGGLGFPALLTRAELGFNGFTIASGGLGLDVTLEKFFNLELSADLTLSGSGISAWSLGGSTTGSFAADAGFATLTVSDLGAGYDSTSGLFFSMATQVAMKSDAVLSALPDDLELSGLKVYADSISIDSAEMANSFSGASGSLGGLQFDLNKLGLGYNDSFYLLAGGSLNIADLCEAGAEIKLYQDLSFDLDEIDIAFTNPAVEFSGMLAMYDADPVYGTGFAAQLDVLVANTLPLSGVLQVGKIASDQGAYTYWRVAMKASTSISLAPLPLNIYALGGGIAHNMTVTVNPDGINFSPDSGSAFALTALLDMGSLDSGYTYFGKFSLTMEPQNMRVVLAGDSWFMKGKSATGTPHLAATLELGGSPAMVHVVARASLAKELEGMTLLGVGGEVDLLFCENDWHIYFGSASQQLDVTLLEFLTGSGYIQLDSSGIAMGVRYEFDLDGKAWIFYGRLYGGAQVDLSAGIKPFYIDARGKIWVGLEAGVKVGGSKYEILSAYAELAGQFKAPPVYIGLRGKLHYSFLYGTISGTWKMTFTMPEHPAEGAGDGGAETLPLFSYAMPEDGATGVSRLDGISVHTALPLMEPFQYDDGQWYILCVKDPTHPNDVVDFRENREAVKKALSLKYGSEQREIVGGLLGNMEMHFTPYMELGANKTYNYSTTLQLRTYTPATQTIGPLVNEENVQASFTTTNEEINIRERIYSVYPQRSTTPVYSGTDVYIITKAVFDGYIWNWALADEKLTFELVNAAGESIPGTISGLEMVTDSEEGSRRYLLRFTPETPLQPVVMVENAAGIKRPAILIDGKYNNPFATETAAQAAAQTTTSPGVSGVSNLVSSSLSGMVNTTISLANGIQEHYTWSYNGEHQIRIRNADGDKVFSSKFTLTTPQSGQTQTSYTSSADVVAAGIRNPHFNVNFSLDQEAYKTDIERGYQEIVVAGINGLWPAYVSSTYADSSAACRYQQPEDIPIYLIPFVKTWQQVESLGSDITTFYRLIALKQCEPLATRIERLEQEFNDYKQSAFSRNPSDEFQSLELRFNTAAPLNWNEIDLRVNVDPSYRVNLAGVTLRPPVYSFARGEWFLRSNSSGTSHILELKPNNKEDFSGAQLLFTLRLLHSQQPGTQPAIGSAIFYRRELSEEANNFSAADSQYNMSTGQQLLNSGAINTITPDSL